MKKLFFILLATCVFFAAHSCHKSITQKPEPDPVPIALELSQAQAMDFTITVTVLPQTGNYYIGVANLADYHKSGGPEQAAQAFIDMENKLGHIDWGKADGLLVHNGSKTIHAGKHWNLKPKTQYAVVAFGVSADGQMTTLAAVDSIATTPVGASSNNITLSVDAEKGIVTASTTNDDPYFLDCIEQSRIDGYPIDKLAEFIIGSYGPSIEYCIESGNVERDFSKLLEEDTGYVALAFGYIGGYPTTDVVMKEFRTPVKEPEKDDCTFTSEVSDVTMTSAKVTVTPSREQTKYMWNVHSKTMVASYIGGEGLDKLVADELEIIAEALSEQYGVPITPEQAAGMITVSGQDTDLFNNLTADSEYYVLAVGLDSKGRITTDIYLSEPFRTKAAQTGPDEPMDCQITVNGATDDGLSVSVVPADKQMTYAGMAGEKSFYDEYGSDKDYLADDIAMWTEMASAEYMTLVELLQAYGLFLKGDATYIFPESFEAGTEYMAYTYGLDGEGNLTSSMAKVFFILENDGSVTTIE